MRASLQLQSPTGDRSSRSSAAPISPARQIKSLSDLSQFSWNQSKFTYTDFHALIRPLRQLGKWPQPRKWVILSSLTDFLRRPQGTATLLHNSGFEKGGNRRLHSDINTLFRTIGSSLLKLHHLWIQSNFSVQGTLFSTVSWIICVSVYVSI